MTTNKIELCLTKEELENILQKLPSYPCFIVKKSDAARRLIEKLAKDVRPGSLIMLEKDEFKVLKKETIVLRLQ